MRLRVRPPSSRSPRRRSKRPARSARRSRRGLRCRCRSCSPPAGLRRLRGGRADRGRQPAATCERSMPLASQPSTRVATRHRRRRPCAGGSSGRASSAALPVDSVGGSVGGPHVADPIVKVVCAQARVAAALPATPGRVPTRDNSTLVARLSLAIPTNSHRSPNASGCPLPGVATRRSPPPVCLGSWSALRAARSRSSRTSSATWISSRILPTLAVARTGQRLPLEQHVAGTRRPAR